MKKANKKIGVFIILVSIIFIPLVVFWGVWPQDNTANAADNTSFCTIISAVWSPSKIDNYKDDGTDVADIVVKTKNCAGAIGVNFTVWGISAASHPLPSITNKPINIPNDNFSLHIALGEEKCSKSITNTPDCDLAIGFNQGNQDIFYSGGKPSGELFYNCTGLTCLGRDAKFLSLIDQGSDDKPVEVSALAVLDSSSIYNMLAPIGGIERMDSSGNDPTCAADPKCITNDIGKYLNIIFKLAIGICAALAVIMLIINGVKYMGDESVFGKTEAKKNMFGAIVGLLIALGAWALLNTINPALTGQNGLNISSANVEIVNLPDAGDSTVDPDFKNQTGTYSTSTVSPGVQDAINKIKSGMSIKSFEIDTKSKTMVIALQNGTREDYSSLININIGKGGVSEMGRGVTGDTKTPKGFWKILEIRTSKENKPVFNKTGSNMGASFWLLSPTTNGDRGIGMHGDKSGTTSNATIGCIKLKNSDILALLPYIKIGMWVNIQ